MTEEEDVVAEVNRVITGGSRYIYNLPFRDPSSFKALHNHLPLWDAILTGNSDKTRILGWQSTGVDIKSSMRPFKGLFKGVQYDSAMPPRKVLKDHPVCKQFADI